jgi:hypothetical protein
MSVVQVQESFPFRRGHWLFTLHGLFSTIADPKQPATSNPATTDHRPLDQRNVQNNHPTCTCLYSEHKVLVCIGHQADKQTNKRIK